MTPRQHPEIVDPLAAEYVLGTLRGPARKRFEKWLADTPSVQERCRFWEENLMQLAKGLRPVQPPAHVWQGIRARLNLTLTPPGRLQPQRRPARVWAIAASVLLVAGLAGVLYWRSIGLGTPSAVASITAPAGWRAWEVDVYRAKARLVVHAGPMIAHPAGHDYELWALPAGGKPVSLGVMPVTGDIQRELTSEQQQALAASAQVAVTLEQAGGSPTGQPTTTPIFVAPLQAKT